MVKISKKRAFKFLAIFILIWVSIASLITAYFFYEKNRFFPFWVHEEVSIDKLGIPVITYHSVLDPDEFEGHLKYLVKNNYKTLSCDEFYEKLTSKNKNAKIQKSIVLTFDDGLYSLWGIVYPLLKKYNLKGVAFIPIYNISNEDIVHSNLEDVWAKKISLRRIVEKEYKTKLTWKEIEIMNKTNIIDFQSHSVDHKLIYTVPKGSFATDEQKKLILYNFIYSKKIIEEHLPGKVVQHFCYPNYKGSKDSVELAKNIYLTNFWGYIGKKSNYIGDDPYYIDRIEEGHNVILSLPGKERLTFIKRIILTFMEFLFPVKKIQIFLRSLIPTKNTR
ncbi:MAG: polysaccharide deacetylase family protein [Candidatus Omnitrophica bacterium]|nr:polysaccharide deacetylase family protein [Candidatus Omnitrophota bacterium]